MKKKGKRKATSTWMGELPGFLVFLIIVALDIMAGVILLTPSRKKKQEEQNRKKRRKK